ncbi:hypothetical protein CRG98_017939 [Punica granatum]|uniref:Uncharacterized protein n=1 Tax=Punica granatum TaxID=22663 RepID=A0A2I0JZH7_PUNGR|nr:hypothetical protein CRG98_017939 [Punica granatum]
MAATELPHTERERERQRQTNRETVGQPHATAARWLSALEIADRERERGKVETWKAKPRRGRSGDEGEEEEERSAPLTYRLYFVRQLAAEISPQSRCFSINGHDASHVTYV